MSDLTAGQAIEHIQYGEGVVVDPKPGERMVEVEWPDGEVSEVRKDRLLAPPEQTMDYAAALGFVRLTLTNGEPAYTRYDVPRNVWIRKRVVEVSPVGISHGGKTVTEERSTVIEVGADGSVFEVKETPEQVFMLLAQSAKG